MILHRNTFQIPAPITQGLSLATRMIQLWYFQVYTQKHLFLGVTPGKELELLIQPTTATRYNDAVLLNGETTVEDPILTGFYSGGNFLQLQRYWRYNSKCWYN